MLNFVDGNFFRAEADMYVNTVNCVGVMGKGVTLHFKAHYPKMFLEYRALCKAGRIQPGVLHIWREFGVEVINLPTKRHWRDSSHFEDIVYGLSTLRRYLDNYYASSRVAIPALGCGNGGLSWHNVRPTIECLLDGTHHNITIYNPICAGV